MEGAVPLEDSHTVLVSLQRLTSLNVFRRSIDDGKEISLHKASFMLAMMGERIAPAMIQTNTLDTDSIHYVLCLIQI